MQAKIVEVIWTQGREGIGDDESDPVRMIAELWTKDGRLIARADHFKGESTVDFSVLLGLGDRS